MDGYLVLSHDPGPAHGEVKLKVIRWVMNKKVEWECVSTHPTSSPASAWTGTHFLWELTKGTEGNDGSTVLDFRETGYDENSKYFGSNNFAWAGELQKLKKRCESRLTTAAASSGSTTAPAGWS
jgi:hypothetical protein